ncbi:MAG TPA: hypothetical protein VF282_02975 [Bacillota bacterium]
MTATYQGTVELTARELEVLAEATDFAGIGCSIAALDIEPGVEFDELDSLTERLREAAASEAPLALEEREARVLVALLDYQELSCPPESWSSQDVEQEELNAIRERLRRALGE